MIEFLLLSVCSILVGLGVAKFFTKARSVADLERTAEAREMGLVAIAAAERQRKQTGSGSVA